MNGKGKEGSGATQRIVRKTFLSGMSEGSAAFLFLGGVLIARGLGPENYGRFSFAISVTVVLGLVMDLDLASFYSREFGRGAAGASRDLATGLGLQLVTAFLFLFLMAGVFSFLDPDATTPGILAAAVAATLFHLVKKTIRGILRGRGHFGAEAVSMICERAGIVVVGLLTLLLGWSALRAMIAFAALRLVDLVILLAYTHGAVHTLRFDLGPARVGRLLVRMLPFATTVAAWAIYNHTDSLMLGFIQGAEAVGQYAAIHRIFEGLLVIPTALAGVMLPWMAYEHSRGGEKLQEIVIRGFRYLLLTSMMVVAAALSAPEEILGFLYGERFEAASGGLMLLLGAAPFVFLFWFIRSVFIAIHRTRVIAVLGVASLLFNVLANLFAIPRFGVAGACGATFLTEVIAFIIGILTLRRQGVTGSGVRPWIVSILAGGACALLMFLSRQVTGMALLGAAPGALAMHLVACRLGFYTREERRMLARYRLAW